MRPLTLIVCMALAAGGCVLDDRTPKYAGVQMVTNAEEARVFLDGQDYGPAFTGALVLDPGTHHVEVKSGANVLASADVNLAAGQTGPLLDARLPSATVASSFEGKDLFIDGQPRGKIVLGQSYVLSAGSHLFEAREGSRSLASQRVELTAQHVRSPLEVMLYPGMSQAAAPSHPSAVAPSAGLPATPDRAALIAALTAIEGQVQRCDDGGGGVVNAEVTFASSGEVQAVDLPPRMPASMQTCLERAIRRARVSPFTQPSFTLNYPFQL